MLQLHRMINNSIDYSGVAYIRVLVIDVAGIAGCCIVLNRRTYWNKISLRKFGQTIYSRTLTSFQIKENLDPDIFSHPRNSQSDGLVQDCSNSTANALELLQSSTKPSKFECNLNSLGSSDAIWRQKTRSTLAQVMACCLTAPNHYLNQCCLIISKV